MNGLHGRRGLQRRAPLERVEGSRATPPAASAAPSAPPEAVPCQRPPSGPAPSDGPSSELLDMILAVMPDAAVVVDAAGTVVAVNGHIEALFGYRAADLVGHPVEVLVPERFRVRHRSHRAGYDAEPSSRTMGSGLGLVGRRRDGSEFPVDVSLAPLGEGRQPLVVAAVRDMTERMAAVAVHARLATIVETSQDGIITLTEQCRVATANGGTERLLGYSAAELQGRHVSELVPDEESGALEALLASAVDHRHSPPFDTRWRSADGALVDVAVSLSALGRAGEPDSGFSLILRDITERKQAEASAARHRSALAAMADVRLAMLGGSSLAELLRLVGAHLGGHLPRSSAILVVDASAARAELLDDVGDAAATGWPGTPTVHVPGAVLELLTAGGGPRPRPLADLLQLVAESAPALAATLEQACRRVGADVAVVSGPVAGVARLVGALVVLAPLGVLVPDDVAQVDAMAEQIALALRLARAHRHERDLLLADDRARIARDLHDHVIRELFEAGMRLQSSLPLADERVRSAMADTVADLDRTIDRVRASIFSLQRGRPRGGSGLRTAICDVAAAAAGQLGFDPDVVFTGPVEAVPDALHPLLLAVAREALSNAARHGGTGRAVVEVRADGDGVAVSVSDDGDGSGVPGRRGDEVADLRASARHLGGDLDLSDGPGGGTVVRWHVPSAG